MQEKALRIGDVAEACGVSRDTLRYWEQRGVIPEPPREDSSGYRSYPPSLVQRVRAVKRAKELGLSLDEIGRLFEQRDRGSTCDELADITRKRIAAFRQEIQRLERKIEGLEALTDVCPGDLPATECPVADMLVDA